MPEANSEPPDLDGLEALVREFQASGARELHLRRPGLEVYLSNDGSAPSLSSRAGPVRLHRQADPPSAPTLGDGPLPDGATVISAPNLGTFYGSPKPGATRYVEVGSPVTIGMEVCLIEVMKLFTALRSDQAGRIHAVLAADGDMVEAGQPLFVIAPG